MEFLVHATHKTSSSLVGSLILFPFVTEQEGGDYKSCTWKLFRNLDISGPILRRKRASGTCPRSIATVHKTFIHCGVSTSYDFFFDKYLDSTQSLFLAEFWFAKFWGTPFPHLRRIFLAENTLRIWREAFTEKNAK